MSYLYCIIDSTHALRAVEEFAQIRSPQVDEATRGPKDQSLGIVNHERMGRYTEKDLLKAWVRRVIAGEGNCLVIHTLIYKSGK